MLGIDERRRPSLPLGIGDHMQRKRGLPRRFMAVAFDDPPARKPSDTECHVQRQASRRNRLHIPSGLLPQPQNRHLAEFLADQFHSLLKRSCHIAHAEFSFLRQSQRTNRSCRGNSRTWGT